MTRPAIARGCIEDLRFDERWVHVAGWMFAPGESVNEIEVELDGVALGRLDRVERHDVERVYPHVPESCASGFFGSFAVEPRDPAAWRTLAIKGRVAGDVRTVLESDVTAEFESWFEPPPAPLCVRVGHIALPRVFLLDGLRSATSLRRALARHGALEARSVLDWGVGCGRTLRPLARTMPRARFHGCDVDVEALAWLRAREPAFDLRTCAFEPPTSFGDASFDVVLGLSVLTHLERDFQRRWIEEIARLLVPGGVVLVTVHGRRALELAGSARTRADVLTHGISDDTIDGTLAGVVEPGRYRATFQTATWTRDAFDPVLEIVDHVEAGMAGFQDLVVLRKRA